jgi:replicative DNA helicase
MNAADSALAYQAKGWRPVPIGPGSKVPHDLSSGLPLNDWASYEPDAAALEAWRAKGFGVGVVLGEASGGLVDVDLDAPEAAGLAADFLPPTGAVFGRASKPSSHWLYVARGAGLRRFADGASRSLVELRGAGGQTVFPPTVHPSGEPIAWEGASVEPAEIGAAELGRAVTALAVGCLLERQAPGVDRGERRGLAFGVVDGDATAWASLRKLLPEADARAAERFTGTMPPEPSTPAPHLVLVGEAEGLAGRSARARAYLERCDAAVSGQGGHATAFATALKVVRGFSRDEADARSWEHEWRSLLAAYNARCTPPWSARELAHKLDHALRQSTTTWGFLLDAQPPRTVRASHSRASQGWGEARAETPPTPEPWEGLPPSPGPTAYEPSAPGELARLPFPSRALPGALRAFVEAESTFSETPPDLAGVLALAACSAAIAGKVRLRVRGDHVEPLNLMFVVAMPPGERKSAVFASAFAPIEAYEKALAESMRPMLAKAAAEREALQGTIADLRRRLRKAPVEQKPELEAELADTIRKRDEAPPPTPPRLLASDATPEKIAQLLAEQGGRLCIAEAEGTIFEVMAGRYSKTGASNLEVFLKGHAGDALRVDRLGRDALFVARPALTMALAIQPDVLRSAADRREFRARGMLARLLVALPTSRVGTRTGDTPAMPPEVRRAYDGALRGLLAIRLPTEGEPTPLVELSEEAGQVWRAFSREIERMLAPGGQLAEMRDWGGKLPGAVARLAAVLHFAEAAAAGDDARREAWHAPIDEATMHGAIEIGRYFLGYARFVFGELLVPERERVETDRLVSALAVLDWLDPTKRGLTAVEVITRLWPAEARGPVPSGALDAREVIASFAGVRSAGKPTALALGHALRRAKGRDAGGWRLEQAGKAHRGVARWVVVPSTPETTPPSHPFPPDGTLQSNRAAGSGGGSGGGRANTSASPPVSPPCLTATAGYEMPAGGAGGDGGDALSLDGFSGPQA